MWFVGFLRMATLEPRDDPRQEQFWEAEFARCIEKTYSDRAFRAHFAVSPSGCAAAWTTLLAAAPADRPPQPRHLLWTLHYLAQYDTTEVSASFFGVSAPTYKKAVVAVRNVLGESLEDVVRQNGT
jgi:hypothetical protein